MQFYEKVRRSMPPVGEGERVGVALSGGADSVALLAALLRAGYRCVALHCNFGLRGAESERDEQFVRRLCGRLECELHTVRFDVAARRRVTGESVEMACRELRYNWFEHMADELGLTFVAVAHHREDNVETFFLNVLRGSGAAGMAGMRALRGRYVRPMLDLTRTEIEEFLDIEGLDFVTDSTNGSCDFSRNRLRNSVMPQLERDFPGAAERISRSMRHLMDDWLLLEGLLAQKHREYVDEQRRVDVAGILRDEPAPGQLLFRLLRMDYPEFDADVARQIVVSARSGNSGKYFDVGDTRFLLDRGVLVPLTDSAEASDARGDDLRLEFDLADPSTLPAGVTLEEVGCRAFAPDRKGDTLWLDADAMQGDTRLIIRAPREGDRLEPYGMKGSRLLSDIFRDAKLSDPDKRRLRVVEAAATGRILLVGGLRASRHYPVKGSTKRIYKLTFNKFALFGGKYDGK